MTSKPQVLLDEVDLVEKIYEITQTMFVTLSQWQAGVTIDWESAKIKGRAELMDLVQSQKIAWADEVIGRTWPVFDEPEAHQAELNQAKNELISEQRKRNQLNKTERDV